MKILNTEKEDYHVHSLNFSDGLATINEIVKFAGELGMKKLVFIDHSEILLETKGIMKKTFRVLVPRWRNVYNNVEVVFGVEADLLNEKGDICDHIQGIKGDFTVLSYHRDIYSGDKKKLTQAFINAIERFHENIDLISHLFVDCENIDVLKVVETANKYNIPLELNCAYLVPERHDRIDMNKLKLMLSKAKSIYVNSDAHTLYELKVLRKKGFEFLKENGFIK